MARTRLSRIDPAGRSRSHAPGCEAAHSGTLPSHAPPSRFYAPPHSGSAGAGRQTALRLPFASGCAHRRRGICGHPALWQQAYIDILPDVASGRCVQLRLSLRAFPVGIARQRDRMRTLRATCIVTGPVIWHSMTIRHMHAAISVRNPQAIRPRSRSAMQQANTLRRSEITNFRVSSALECLAHAMEARLRQDFTRGERCPRLQPLPTDFIRRTGGELGTGIPFFSTPGVSGDHRSRLETVETNSVQLCPQ